MEEEAIGCRGGGEEKTAFDLSLLRSLMFTLLVHIHTWGDVGGKLDGIFHDMVDEGVDGVGVKGWGSHIQLVEDDSEGPEVDGVVVGLLLH